MVKVLKTFFLLLMTDVLSFSLLWRQNRSFEYQLQGNRFYREIRLFISLILYLERRKYSAHCKTFFCPQISVTSSLYYVGISPLFWSFLRSSQHKLWKLYAFISLTCLVTNKSTQEFTECKEHLRLCFAHICSGERPTATKPVKFLPTKFAQEVKID